MSASDSRITRIRFKIPFVGIKERIGEMIIENWDWIPMVFAGLLAIIFAFITAADFEISRLFPGELAMTQLLVNSHLTRDGQIVMWVLMFVIVAFIAAWVKLKRR